MDTLPTIIGADDGDENPLSALRRVAQHHQELQRLEHYYVLRARAAGVSWQGIAAALGVSKQAIHRRYKGYRATSDH